MKITEKILIDNLDSFTRSGFVSVIDGKDCYWAYLGNDGNNYREATEPYDVTHIEFSFNKNFPFSNGKRIDAFHSKDPRRENIMQERMDALKKI